MKYLIATVAVCVAIIVFAIINVTLGIKDLHASFLTVCIGVAECTALVAVWRWAAKHYLKITRSGKLLRVGSQSSPSTQGGSFVSAAGDESIRLKKMGDSRRIGLQTPRRTGPQILTACIALTLLVLLVRFIF